MLMQSLLRLVVPVALAMTAGCERQPAMVYVLESPQMVTLTASASTSKVQQGATVLLHVERHVSGKWKQIPRDRLKAGQCWEYQPPPQREAEVADTVHWEVVPENGVRFAAEYRTDHSRSAIMIVKGTIQLTPLTAVRCEPDRVVAGPPIRIEVS